MRISDWSSDVCSSDLEWINRFRGAFDQGWDKVREESFACQKKAGIISGSTVLTPRPAELPAWDSLSSTEERVHARMMEVAAATLHYQDTHLGRILDRSEEHTSELQSLMRISYAVLCSKNRQQKNQNKNLQ